MPGDFPNLTKKELFTRLAQGHAAGITVVTPNRRLAQVLRAQYDEFQSGKGLSVWEDADILPLESFVGRRYEDAQYADGGGDLPVLLSSAQSRALWEEAIRASHWANALLDVPQTAASAQRAWQIAQEWRFAGALEKFEATEDTRAFGHWAKAYRRILKKDALIDVHQLFDVEIKIDKPGLLVAYAFDAFPTQTKEYLERFEWVSCSPEIRKSSVKKASFASPREELEAAARWARARLEKGGKHIGVVVPDLKKRRREVARVFTRVMVSPRPFELSIGEPLSDYPLVAFALDILEFSGREMPFEKVSRLIRSPFLSGAQQAMAARARQDSKLRREAGVEISLPKLIGMIGDEPGLRSILESVFRKAREQTDKPLSADAWAVHFSALLALVFSGARATDSAEYQSRAKFDEVLGDFARLSLVAPKMPFRDAIRRMRGLCTETRFQPEGIGAPIRVLEILESPGIEFDALWVSGLTDEEWPQRIRPNPFLPAALQIKAGVPEASAEASLALDRRRTEGWLGAADEVIFSWARREDDRELLPSPLIAQVPEGAVELPDFGSFRDLLFASRAVETVDDEKANPLQNMTVRGGTRVLADQAACPFRAYARHRLGAEALDAPEPGPDAMARGSLLHKLMAGIWTEVKTKEGLARDISSIIARAAETAVKDQEIEGPFAELEKQRLIRLAIEWLEVERGREDFSVVAVEKKVDISIGPLSFSGRIDRMDRLADGTHAIIDYKTGGRATPNDWMGERPEEPQLPLYVVSAIEDVSAAAFARLKTGAMKFAGFSQGEKAIPGVKAAKSWPALVQYWKAELEGLAGGYARGEARVDPKKGLATCRNCDLQPLCRVHERLSALAEEEGVE